MPISGVCARLVQTSILFADGDADVRSMCRRHATAGGFRTVLARDGYEALVLAHRVRPDALVLDTRLAGLSGFEVIRRLRSAPATRSMVIVVLTDEDGEAFDARITASGCDARLVKPCAMATLFRLLSTLDVRATPSLRTYVTDGSQP